MKIFFLMLIFAVSLFSSTNEALQAYKNKQYTKAFSLYMQEAKKGDTSAQNAVSYLYFNGIGVQQSKKDGVLWLKKAAKSGDDRACLDLGMMYLTGVNIGKEYAQALKWLECASKKGNAEASYNLALMYYNGDGVKQDIKKAAELLEMAAKAGHKGAKKNVGRIYMQLLDFKKAKYWLSENVKEGDVEAATLLKEIEASKKD
ncbi:tetratricopeptide repeat protein [Sulfurimonas paralvinellae]|nr:tetratricopeptide repeat protein [Sulfurimonas paralvinellae]